jgi:hypothetical protein
MIFVLFGRLLDNSYTQTGAIIGVHIKHLNTPCVNIDVP